LFLEEYAMLAPRVRGAFLFAAVGLLALMSACSNGTEPKQSLCDASNPVSLNVGEVRPSISDVCVYLSNSQTAEYALVPFNADTSYKRTSTITFTSSGASTISTPLQKVPLNASPLFNQTATSAAVVTASRVYDIMLRQSERRFLAPRMAAARAWYNRRITTTGTSTGLRPSFSTTAATWAVGDIVTLNTQSGDTFADACQTPDNRTGRVVAISNKAIVVADQNNPSGGYTDAEYLQVGVQFDSVYAMDVAAFGQPSDIDANGKIVMFFTRAVNELTPQNSSSVVGGFFYGRDLFPKQDTPELGVGSGCATSNYSEMFYLAVPDPNFEVNGNRAFTKDFVSHLTVSTTAHEFQHLINASRRLYVNTAATDFEVVWLNEGLSHIAEELLFYLQSDGLAPRMNIDSTRFKGNQKNVNAYNFDQASNFGRFRSYLGRPASSSPYAPDDSLWTRGATWSFLRYAADHRGTADADTWQKLVNSTTTGMFNLQNVFGNDVASLFRNWAVANISDDIAAGTPNDFLHPSWNYRSVYHFLPSIRAYPLSTVTVGDGSPSTVTLNGGGAAYVRFTIPAGQLGSVKWDTQAIAIDVSLVRLK
jgi:hypothetical protein